MSNVENKIRVLAVTSKRVPSLINTLNSLKLSTDNMVMRIKYDVYLRDLGEIRMILTLLKDVVDSKEETKC